MRAAPGLFALLAFLCAAPREALAFGFASMPEWPGTPVAYIGNEPYTIVAYKGIHPIALVNGVMTQVDGAPISVKPAKKFRAGTIKLEDSEADNVSLPPPGSIGWGQGRPSYTTFYAKLTSDADLSDVYMILLVFEAIPNGDYRQLPRILMQGKRVGDLAAGKRKTFRADLSPLFSRKQTYWSALFFSNGIQVKTSQGNGVLDSLFDIEDHVNLNRLIQRRSSGDHRVEVFRRLPLVFTDAIRKKYAGQQVTAELTIAPSGSLDNVRVDGTDDRELAEALVGQFGYWLFVPRIADGQPTSTTVEVPVKF